MIRLSDVQLVARLKTNWDMAEPSLVVSMVPYFNRAIAQSIRQTLPDTSFVTLMTDMADQPPYFWVEPGFTQHLICGTDYVVTQALNLGISPCCYAGVINL